MITIILLLLLFLSLFVPGGFSLLLLGALFWLYLQAPT